VTSIQGSNTPLMVMPDIAHAQRVLTGFNSRYDNGRARIQVFAAESTESRRLEEIPGNGTALLFRLNGAPIVANSEIVELIVRDRENPGLVLSVERMSRFGDYTIDSISGELSFSEVVSSFDNELNPIFVRVTYDQESGGEKYTVAGARARYELSKSLHGGASVTHDSSPIDGGTLAGGYISWQPSDDTTVTTAVAHTTHKDDRPAGDAQRLTVEHRWGDDNKRSTSIVAARADASFDKPGAGIGAGRQELRLEHRDQLSAGLRAKLEATHSESTTDNELRRTAGASLHKSFIDWTLRAGARQIRQRVGNQNDSFSTASIGAERRFKIGDRAASAEVDIERDVARASRNRISVGSRVQLHEHVHVNARFERQNGIYNYSSVDGRNTTDNASIGVESDVVKYTRMYSEYRMRGSVDGRDQATATGIRGKYEVTPGLTISPSIEMTNSRNPNVRASAQAEYRNGKSADYIGIRASYAARLNLDWSVVAQEDVRRQIPNGGEADMRHAFTLGLSRRPRLNNRHHMLFKYQWKIERAEGETGDRDVHVLSSHQNFQVNSRFWLSGRIGGKHQTTFLVDRDFDTAAYVADIRANWDINRRWSFNWLYPCTGPRLAITPWIQHKWLSGQRLRPGRLQRLWVAIRPALQVH